MEPALPVGAIFSYCKNALPKLILKRMYPLERLESLIHVDIKPRHDSVMINLGSSGNAQVWLQITNLSPFEIILDRSELNLFCGSKIKLSSIIPKTLKPFEITNHFVESNAISTSQTEDIRLNIQHGSFILDGQLSMQSAIHSLVKHISLDGVNPRFINLQLPNKS